jgi:hypothetical protein
VPPEVSLQSIDTGFAKNLRARPSVAFPMAVSTECDQIVHRIATQLAPTFHVMDVKVLHRTAFLTPPTISFKHSLPDDFVLSLSQLEPWLFLAERRRNRPILHCKT